MEGMTVKAFIKLLSQYNQNAKVSITALTPDGNYEEWYLGKAPIKEHDNGATLSLLTVRLNKVTNTRIMKQAKMLSVASVRCSIDDVIERFGNRYSFKVLSDTFGKDEHITNKDAYKFFDTILELDIEDLIILKEDLRRLATGKD